MELGHQIPSTRQKTVKKVKFEDFPVFSQLLLLPTLLKANGLELKSFEIHSHKGFLNYSKYK